MNQQELSSEKITEKHANVLHATNGLNDFIFELDFQMFRCRIGKNAKMRIKNILMAEISLLEIINKGTEDDPAYHYLIQVQLSPTGEQENILFSAREFGSYGTFKRKLLSKRALFLGTRDDYIMLMTSRFLLTKHQLPQREL